MRPLDATANRDSKAPTRDEAARWLARLQSSECSPGERRQFDAWLRQDDSHRREFEVMRRLWDRLEGLQESAVVAREQQRRPVPRKLIRAAWIGGAAAAVIVTGPLLLLPSNDMTIETAIGEQRRLTLGDGTVVHANTGTVFEVHYSDARRRIEIRRGEVYVMVAADPLRPLEVVAGGATIRDVGTRFNVRQRDEAVRIAVAEGAIEVSLREAGGVSRRVQIGERVECSPAVIGEPEPADVAAEIAWTEGRIVFDRTPLAEAFGTLSRYRRVPVLIGDRGLATHRVSGVFRVNDTDGALWGIQQLVPIRYQRDGDRLLALPADPPEPFAPPALQHTRP